MCSMTLQNDKYFVEIGQDSSYAVGSSDNRRCDLVINPDNFCGRDMYKSLRISVEGIRDAELILVTDYQLPQGSFAILEEDTLTVLHHDYITQIDLSCMCASSRQLDIVGTTFSLYRIADGYVIHGELEILRLDDALQTVWQFSGKDAFVSISGKESFALTEDSIRLNDFQDNFYELDLDGQVLRMVVSE